MEVVVRSPAVKREIPVGSGHALATQRRKSKGEAKTDFSKSSEINYLNARRDDRLGILPFLTPRVSGHFSPKKRILRRKVASLHDSKPGDRTERDTGFAHPR